MLAAFPQFLRIAGTEPKTELFARNFSSFVLPTDINSVFYSRNNYAVCQRRLKSDTAGIEALTFVRRDTVLRLTMWTEVVKMSTRRMKSSQL